MIKTPIKITLKRSDSALSGSGDYKITRICRAITVDADKRNMRVGDILTTQEAEKLSNTRIYEVTVVV